MLIHAVLFFVLALVAALIGFTGIAAGMGATVPILVVIFLVLAAANLAVTLWRRGP